RPGTWPILEATVIGYFFNTILPARAGEAARVVSLNRRSATSRAESLATVGVERVWDVGVLLALLAASLSQRRHVAWTGAAEVLAAALLAAVVLLVVTLVAFGNRPAVWAARRLGGLPGVRAESLIAGAERLVHGMGALHRPRLVAGALLWTVTSWCVLAVSTWCVLLAFHLHLGFMGGVLVVVATGLSMAIPAGPAGVGVFEAAVLVALAPFGVPKTDALSAALVLHALNIVPFIVAGLIVLQVHARGSRAPVTPRPAEPRSRAGV
ncbi:MAG TPA: lysylphosphatidylglycerol synthase transmembrane domain-containing protein, partial [Gaiellales bacterium]|nr:lysylphosphatidylglycerol synthase transmembrane domain-containing protein [Gaiellales bacterium]